MTAGQQERTFEIIDGQVEGFALDVSDRPVKFRETNRMKRLNKGQLPYNKEDFTDSGYVIRCLADKNYRALFAYMNSHGYNHISFEMAFRIPLPDILSIFPQGCFKHILVSEQQLRFPQQVEITSIDFMIIYCWLFGSIGDVVYALFKAVLYMKMDFDVVVSRMTDLKQHPLEVIEVILRNDVYRDAIMMDYLNIYDDSRFLGQARRIDLIGIKADVISLVNIFLRLLDPYLNFYAENNQSYRVAFIAWSLPVVDFDYFCQYHDRLNLFRSGLFDFGPLPVWSKESHLKYPLEFRQQVKTVLLLKARKGNIVNRLFHKDLLVVLFQYMAFNSLLIEEEDMQHQYHCTINVSYREEEDHKTVGRPRKHQRRTE
jgi:hypothetical protein